MAEAAALDRFRRESDNLYERVRAQFFLYSIHRFHLPYKTGVPAGKPAPPEALAHILQRRFHEALDSLLAFSAAGPTAALSSALAAAYQGLAFQTLAAQVRRSVRAVRGNQWMSRIGHPADYPLVIRPELLDRPGGRGAFPILRESTPVRMDLSHSGWSDIFFLGMDFPEGARVLNVSIDLALRGSGDAAPPTAHRCLPQGDRRACASPDQRRPECQFRRHFLSRGLRFCARLPGAAEGRSHRRRHRSVRDWKGRASRFPTCWPR